ncbi:MAG: SH3 domain-containing protein [Candidatus Promineifilaceae bacterium]|nr:SH3 domain-containing protein [Candidatus Promineifilaceae bacterium]
MGRQQMKVWRLAGIFFVLSLMVLGSVHSAQASGVRTKSASYLNADATASVRSYGLNVRAGPGVGYERVAVLARGNEVTLLGRNANATWAYIETSRGVKGWVSAPYLNSPVAISSLPVVGVTPTPSPSPATGVINTYALNVRNGPGAGYAVQIALPRNTQLALLGRNAAGTWLQVRRPGGAIGWVDASYIHTTANISNLPVAGVSDPPDPDPAPATGIISSYALNVRSGPGVSFRVLTAQPRDTQLTLLGRNAAGSWLRVRLPGGLEGWASAYYISTSANIWNLPVVGAGPAPAASGHVATGALNVRNGPGVAYGAFTAITWGTQVDLLGRAADSLWVRVRLPGGQIGWVNSAYLRMNVTLDSLPVINQ